MSEEKANWPEGSWVEINLIADETRWGHDPNRYVAKCMTSGTWPMLEVVCDDDLSKRHSRFDEPLFEGDYAIWRIVRNADGTIPPPPSHRRAAPLPPREPEKIVVRPEDLRRRRRRRKTTNRR